MSFLLGFFLEASIGLIGFWFLEVSSLLFVYMLFNFFLSGHMFPLDMLPEPWDRLVDMLPLKYLAYYPAAIFLGKVPRDELIWGLWVEAAWVLFFIVHGAGHVPAGRASLQRVWRVDRWRTKRPSYGSVFLTFARNSLVRDIDVPHEFHSPEHLVGAVDPDERRFLPDRVSAHAADRSRERLGQVRVLRLPGDDLADQQRGADVFHDECG